jgi:hypothetical protein
MTARFVSLAVGYALGSGVLRRKGAAQRPWLELRRLETESAYLNHQVRLLRQAATGPVRFDQDTLPGRGFYDIARARLHSPLLERAIELLQPDGQPRLNGEVLQVAGLRGLASLWLDLGQWRADGSARLPLQAPSDAGALVTHLRAMAIETALVGCDNNLVAIPAAAMARLASLLRPQVPRSMRRALHPGSTHGASLLKRRRLV